MVVDVAEEPVKTGRGAKYGATTANREEADRERFLEVNYKHASLGFGVGCEHASLVVPHIAFMRKCYIELDVLGQGMRRTYSRMGSYLARTMMINQCKHSIHLPVCGMHAHGSWCVKAGHGVDRHSN